MLSCYTKIGDEDMKKITYGILSTASIVGRFIQGVRDSQDGDVGAICSRNIHKARQKAREFQIDKAYDDYSRMLADEDLDVMETQGIGWSCSQDPMLRQRRSMRNQQ